MQRNFQLSPHPRKQTNLFSPTAYLEKADNERRQKLVGKKGFFARYD
jgi:hypothetical protein